MSKRGPIILVDDDKDDLDLLHEVISDLGYVNEIRCFDNTQDVYYYLLDNLNIAPFLIISDYNLPRLNGLELKKKIDDNHALRSKSIPFIFYSTSADRRFVNAAFQYSIQGFFTKGTSVAEIKARLTRILEYWTDSLQPQS